MNGHPGPLSGLRILDLTRILAGPTCSQLLGDLGADVIKLERPGEGDDTRKWGPPYLKDRNGREMRESAYFLASNRNKRSLTVDMAKPAGQRLVRRLLEGCDVLVQNFKAGTLAKHKLDYESLKEEFPHLVYCSISGFGQSGPYSGQAGYDYLAQAQGGIMSITGAPDGPPMKVGIGISDVMCGMYAAVAVLAALRHRDATGEGQHIDLALLDTTVAWLVNEGVNYFLSGQVPKRLGNAHPNIVPYQLLETADGHFTLAVGNEAQFRKFCDFSGLPELPDDPRFRTNSDRIRNRDQVMALIQEAVRRRPTEYWVDGLTKLGVPAGPVNDIAEVFRDPQVLHREMKIALPNPDAADGAVPLIGNPIKLSGTPVTYRRPPPRLGQHTDEVLGEFGLDRCEIDALARGEDHLRKEAAGMADKIKLSEEEWRKKLSPEQFYICRLQGTERPFTGRFNKCDISGLYVCVCCGNPLFRSETKFDSHCGWPSFFEAVGPDAVELREDGSHDMVRTEVVCARCESHLGHIFDDGPQPTGQRYCMNSVSLALKRDQDKK